LTTAENQTQPIDGTSTGADRYDLVAWRRERVLTLRAKGYTIDAIAAELKAGNEDVKISHGTVINDLKAIREEVNKNLTQFVQDELPMENKVAIAGIKEIIKEAWAMADSARDHKERLGALSLAKEAYLTQQALLGDSRILEQAISWIKKAKKQLEEAQKQ
jgi:hypothetical protein